MASKQPKSPLSKVLLEKTLQPVIRRTLLEFAGTELTEEVREQLRASQEKSTDALKEHQRQSLKELKQEQHLEIQKLKSLREEQEQLLARMRDDMEKAEEQRLSLRSLSDEFQRTRRELESYHEDAHARREALLTDLRWRWLLRFVLAIFPTLCQVITRDDLYLIFGNLSPKALEDLFDRARSRPEDDTVRLILQELDGLPSTEREYILAQCRRLSANFKKLKPHSAAASLLV